jgi:hypothetical protein
MEELAVAGRISADDKPTQVALIFADGNSVGAFLKDAVKAGIAKEDIAPALEAATIGALAEAVRRRFAGWARLPVMAYLVGGDDLLVEVPAIDAWQFTWVLLAEFGRQIEQTAQQRWHKLVPGKLPSLSAGIVFRHYKAPFSDAVRLADEQLHAAKQATRGAAASVAFLDITSDGAIVPGRRKPLRLDYLTANADVLDETARLAASRRAMLLDLLRRREAAMVRQEAAVLAGDKPAEQGARIDRDDAEQQFAKQLISLPNEPLWKLLTGRREPSGVRAELERNPASWDELRRVLDIARYWHTGTRDDLRDSDLSESASGRQA